MDLYVLRHAKAERAVQGDDASRALADKGQRDIRRLGRWIRNHELAIDLMATSPLVRAHETGSLLLQCESVSPSLEIWDELAPGGTVEALYVKFMHLDPAGSVLVVGHEPLLSELVSAAIGGGRFRLAKGALAHIRGFVPGVDGELDWLVTPAVIAPAP